MNARGRLACAALLSLALHGLVISGAETLLPQSPGDPQPLNVRLELAEPKPAPSRPTERAVRRAVPPPVPDVPVIAAASPAALPDALPEAIPEQPRVDPPVEPEPPQRLALAAESSAAVARNLPRRGRITYTLFYGESRTTVGKVVQAWETTGESYRITSDAETTGIVEFFRPQRLRYVSQGRVTRDGLRPDSFLASRTRRGQNEASQARFDWNAGNLDYGIGREPKNAPLASGTQDLLSLLFQYAVMTPKPGRFRVPVTTGSRFEVFEIEVTPEENIETPIGMLRALPVRQMPRPGIESIRVWLAADYHYLPVRIHHYDREGEFSGEQVVSEIRISDE